MNTGSTWLCGVLVLFDAQRETKEKDTVLGTPRFDPDLIGELRARPGPRAHNQVKPTWPQRPGIAFQRTWFRARKRPFISQGSSWSAANWQRTRATGHMYLFECFALDPCKNGGARPRTDKRVRPFTGQPTNPPG